MTTRNTISRSVRNLMRKSGFRSAGELAEAMGVSSEYMPRKLNEGRWSVDDVDQLAEVFGVTPSEIITGKSSRETALSAWDSLAESGPVPVFEIVFELEQGPDITCLALGLSTANEAISSVLSRWTPEHPIVNMGVTAKKYELLHLAPLSFGTAKETDE